MTREAQRVLTLDLKQMGSRGRVGVLTFHRCINYGSYWQARCLVEGLRKRGEDAVLLDHESPRVNRAEWQCGLMPVLPSHVPRSDVPFYALKILKFFLAFSRLPRSPRFSLEHPERMEPCRQVVVGSDEVWNFRHPWYGGCPLFFGSGLRAERVAAYAASFGNYDAAEGLGPEWAERLRRFAAISVRDENSRALVAGALPEEPEVVLDPCLQFPVEPHAEARAPEEPFVLVYGHNFSERFAREVGRWAASRGYPLVSLGYRNEWAGRQCISAGPHDFARSMQHAAAVVTNFFHGCVFALRCGRPFVAESSDYRSVKVRNLLAALGAEAHLVDDAAAAETYDARLDGPPAVAIMDRIDTLRRRSDAYLDRALA